jgi:hypothetical protein
MTMRILALVSPVVLVGALALTSPAHAATIPIKGHSPAQIKANCSGGVYFAPGGKGQTYGCLAQDGSGIVCGGIGDNYKNTCDTFGPSPDIAKPRTRLPSRQEIPGHIDKPQ